MDKIVGLDISTKKLTKGNVFGSLPDARPIQKDLASRFPLDAGRLGKFKQRGEGRSHPVATPESLFPYYLNNYEVARRHLESLSRELNRPLRILEVGCGAGWGSRFLSESLPDSDIVATNRVVNGKDKDVLDTARTSFGKEGLIFEEADATKLAERFGKESFDAVVMLEVIEHIPKELHDDVARQVSSILKPGGAFLMSTPAAEGYGVTTSGPQSKGHVWVYGNRPDVSDDLSPRFDVVEINRIVSKTHTSTFGRNVIREGLLAFGFVKAPESMFSQYTYEQGDALTDEKHAREKDTCAWFAVAKKLKTSNDSTGSGQQKAG